MSLCVSNDYFDALGLHPGPGAMNCLENVLSQTLGGVWFSKMVVCRYQKRPTPALNYSPAEAIMNESDERVWWLAGMSARSKSARVVPR